jgi:predicted nucleic acid-binding protein
MESAIAGLVLDSSVLIAAERRRLSAGAAITTILQVVVEVAVALSAITIAEIGHGIYRAQTPEIRESRRAFLDELKATIPV